jgi:hypothetical protein
MAQLVARFVRNEEVGGSNPPGSTAVFSTRSSPGRQSSTGALLFLERRICTLRMTPMVPPEDALPRQGA